MAVAMVCICFLGFVPGRAGTMLDAEDRRPKDCTLQLRSSTLCSVFEMKPGCGEQSSNWPGVVCHDAKIGNAHYYGERPFAVMKERTVIKLSVVLNILQLAASGQVASDTG